MDNQENALQPLSLDDMTGVIGGALALPDTSDTGPTGGSGSTPGPDINPNVSIQAAK